MRLLLSATPSSFSHKTGSTEVIDQDPECVLLVAWRRFRNLNENGKWCVYALWVGSHCSNFKIPQMERRQHPVRTTTSNQQSWWDDLSGSSFLRSQAQIRITAYWESVLNEKSNCERNHRTTIILAIEWPSLRSALVGARHNRKWALPVWFGFTLRTKSLVIQIRWQFASWIARTDFLRSVCPGHCQPFIVVAKGVQFESDAWAVVQIVQYCFNQITIFFVVLVLSYYFFSRRLHLNGRLSLCELP